MLLHLKGDGPLYRRVCEAVRERIRSGRWQGGMRLPGTRALARDLGVSRIVVLTAYEQLAAEGYLVASRGSGSRVVEQVADRLEPPRPTHKAPRRRGFVSRYARRARRQTPHVAPPRKRRVRGEQVDFSYTNTAPDAKTLQLWRRAVARAAVHPPFDYPEPSGLRQLRKLIAAYLREQRGVVAEAEDLVIVSGSQQALDIIARLVSDDGASVGIEDPHYQGTRQAFIAAGAKLVPCSVDDDGLNIDRHAPRLANVRAVCVTPSHQFPTGVVMSIARRLKLLSWAAARSVWVVEDDYDSEFRYGVGGIPALQSLDTQGRVLYVGTFTRSLFPGLRLGYVVVPATLREHFRAIKWLADRGSSPMEQRALAHLMESGAYESARRRLGRSLFLKRNLMLSALRTHFLSPSPPEASRSVVGSGEVTWSGTTSGTHLFLRFPRVLARDATKLVSAAARHGVRVYSGQPYFLRPPREATLILGYATTLDKDIELGISRLARAYHSAVAIRRTPSG